MIKNLLYKELRLATHPTQFLFLSFGLMLLIPAYPYYVAFFYITLSQFFVTTIGRENNDVSFTAMLPVAKRDVVKARLLMGVIFEVLSLIIAIPFSFLGTFTHPSGNEAGIGIFVDFAGLADLDDRAKVHHPDAGRERHGFFLVVGDDDEGDAGLFLNLDQFILGLFAQLLVECAERLVEQQQLGVLGERAGKGNALALAA